MREVEDEERRLEEREREIPKLGAREVDPLGPTCWLPHCTSSRELVELTGIEPVTS
jgi:hypothetical protein